MLHNKMDENKYIYLVQYKSLFVCTSKTIILFNRFYYVQCILYLITSTPVLT